MKKLSIQQIDKLANLLYKIKLPIISTTNLYKTAGYFNSNTYSINAAELTNLYNFEKINDERSVDFLNNELRVSKDELQSWQAGQQNLGARISMLDKDTTMSKNDKKEKYERIQKALEANKKWQAVFNGRINIINSFLREKAEPVNVDPKIQRILGVEETGKLDANTRKAIEAKKRQLTTDAGGLITDQQLFDHLLNKASLPGRRIF